MQRGLRGRVLVEVEGVAVIAGAAIVARVQLNDSARTAAVVVAPSGGWRITPGPALTGGELNPSG